MEGPLGALAQGLCMLHLHSSRRMAVIRVVGVGEGVLAPVVVERR
mgnify:CR=1 FL=1